MSRTPAAAPPPCTHELLDGMQYVADPLADAAVAQIVGTWQSVAPDATIDVLRAAQQPQWQRLAVATRLLASLQTPPASGDAGTSLASRIGDDPSAPGVGDVLRAYVAQAETLPDWADAKKIARAEKLFIEYGALSCVLLFCASLPECYVIPDLATVLNASGQLEQRTDYRIRMTAAMIFPVMMRGGLAPLGAGIAQVIKVRLIHATIRNLILHDSPQHAVELLGAARNVEGAGVVPPSPAMCASSAMYETMFAHGWKLGENQLPCNQEELAYTLLTFGYVFLRSLRRLGIALSAEDEEAFLHCWNVAGYVLGIVPELLPQTMDQCKQTFALMQERGRADKHDPDPRPLLGRALVATMAQPIPFAVCKPFPALMVRYLCGPLTAGNVGIDGPVKVASGLLFTLLMFIIRGIDSLVRLFVPDFSISRFMTRVLGYRFVTRVLMDQTRPLALPQALLTSVNTMMDAWSTDPKAPDWMNRIEDRLTTPGSWRSAGAAPQPPAAPQPGSD
jgi:hypothetical protein